MQEPLREYYHCISPTVATILQVQSNKAPPPSFPQSMYKNQCDYVRLCLITVAITYYTS